MSSKWCCVLAVVCLSVILLSLDANAQPTVDDDSSQCGSASLQEVANMVSVMASNQLQIENAVRDGIGDVRERIASECEKTNETTLVSEIRDVKKTVEFSCEDGNETRLAEVEKEIKEEISGVKNETNRVLDVLENVVNAIKTSWRAMRGRASARRTRIAYCRSTYPT